MEVALVNCHERKWHPTNLFGYALNQPQIIGLQNGRSLDCASRPWLLNFFIDFVIDLPPFFTLAHLFRHKFSLFPRPIFAQNLLISSAKTSPYNNLETGFVLSYSVHFSLLLLASFLFSFYLLTFIYSVDFFPSSSATLFFLPSFLSFFIGLSFFILFFYWMDLFIYYFSTHTIIL